VIEAVNYPASTTLKDGTTVTIRAIGKDDRGALLAAFDNQDPESIYTRFFTYKRGLTETDLGQLTEANPDHVTALVVTTPIGQGEKLIGGGRYFLNIERHTAELAFMTDDAYRGRGIASLILEHLIRIGREHGVLTFEADVLAQNQVMLGVFRRSGLPMEIRSAGNVVHVKLVLSVDGSPSP
jgi:RimJ/RimL family protein N-acetyltransferase